jgi:hypothetical protein
MEAATMRVKAALVALVIGGAIVAGAPAAHADVPSTASNLGLCSSYLAQLDVPGAGNVRAEVNHVIKQFGGAFDPPLANPGELYKVRAHQHVNGPAPQECTPRQLPGGGQG